MTKFVEHFLEVKTLFPKEKQKILPPILVARKDNISRISRNPTNFIDSL
jgi:hypothetical protein